jgi:hypothetical protein
VLRELQRGLEELYRLEPSPDVRDFLMDESRRRTLGVQRQPREQLLLVEHEGQLEIGLFVDPQTLANLALHDPRQRLGAHNLADFCLAVEGVSHFVYVAFRARAEVPISGLELELQAEIDKYVTCVLLHDDGAGDADDARALRERLFSRFHFAEDLSADERERYAAANVSAARYARSLETRFVHARRFPDMLGELRRFYRMTLADKLDLISDAA